MRVTCSKCGHGLEVGAAPPPWITCPQCGEQSPTNAANADRPPRKQGMSGCLIFAIVLGGMVPIVGILAAIAIPNFIKFQARAKQSECRANLKAMYTAERAFFQERDRYSTSVVEIGFSPERGNRYAYFAATDGTLEDRSSGLPGSRNAEATGVAIDTFRHAGAEPLGPEHVAAFVQPGVEGECPDCNVTLACAGNVDNDEELDVWSISTADRTTADGRTIPAGEPFQHVSDI